VQQVRLLGRDAAGLVLEYDGQSLRLPVDAALRAALADAARGGEASPAAAPDPLSPREIQRRIRAGESAAAIAASSGVPASRVARFEGPVLGEREHHAAQARATSVAGTTLAELAADHLARRCATGEAGWDAWLDADRGWCVALLIAGQRVACWSFDLRSRRLSPLDGAARAVLDPASDTRPRDDLDAVLRPVRAGRPARDEEPPGDDAAAPAAAPGEAADRPARRGRVAIPSWDEISAGAGPPDGA